MHNGSSGSYEVCLDQRKLRTPLGNDFKVNNETLALAVAQVRFFNVQSFSNTVLSLSLSRNGLLRKILF